MRKAQESEPVAYGFPLMHVEDVRAAYRFIFPSPGRKPLDLDLNVPFCPFLGTVVKQKSSALQRSNQKKHHDIGTL